MKFHEIHVGQDFIDMYGDRYKKLSRSTASGYPADNIAHFAATEQVDGLNAHDLQKEHPKASTKYPMPQADYLGGMATLGDAIAHLESSKRANFHETPAQRKLYFDATVSALQYLRASYDALEREWKSEQAKMPQSAKHAQF